MQSCTSDPTVATNWKTYGMFNGGTATLDGFIPATTVYVRVRTAGLKGVMGDWSDAVKIIVT
ncbi:MAG: hypothetical protein M3R10_07145 [Verrucomicrobiota bacterium]|nr:hypothetical protein [Verrucomicrobiota bacterium]